MRISTSTIFENGGSRISDLQVSLNKTQQQIAAGRKILTPDDDPIGAARALVLTQADSQNTQFATNRQQAKNNLQITDGVLGSVTTTLHNVKGLLVQAGSGVLSDADRGFIAAELQGNLDQLFALANSTDGTGNYLFSGFSTTTAPYTQVPGGAKYNGDQGQRYVQVDVARQLPLSEAGTGIFENIRTAPGQFNVRANPNNTGQGQVSASINPATAAALTGNNYEVSFLGSPAISYTVTNKTTGAVVVPTTAYTSPQNVSFDGINLTLNDNPNPPAIGDKFSIQPGNQNIFETLTDIIDALKVPQSTANAKKEFSANLVQASGNLDISLSNVLTSRSKLGVSLKEIDNLDSDGDAKGVAYKSDISAIMDLDYAKALTELSQQSTTLQAAQQSFIKTSELSLFNFLR